MRSPLDVLEYVIIGFSISPLYPDKLDAVLSGIVATGSQNNQQHCKTDIVRLSHGFYRDITVPD